MREFLTPDRFANQIRLLKDIPAKSGTTFLLSEFASQKKLDAFANTYGRDIRSKLLSCAIHVGYLRWVSLRENFSLNFNDLNFGDFMKDPLIVDTAKLINLLRSRSYSTAKSKLVSPLTNGDIHSKMQILMDDTHDQWYVCCGHDIIGILSLWLRKLLGDQKEQSVKTEFLEICLRLAYERSFFAKTQLYAAIRLWEQSNAPFIVLSVE